MKKQFLPYYISRALISAVISIAIVGFDWKAILLTLAFFAFFLLYLHSGWFRVEPQNGFFPLRRDDHGQQVQRKALIAAVVSGLITYFGLSLVASQLDLALVSGQIALGIAVLAYFATQFTLFAKA
jgi:hypothetical protein